MRLHIHVAQLIVGGVLDICCLQYESALLLCRSCELIRKEKQFLLLHGQRGRARQLNVGARHATSDLLCFLHADSRCCRDVVHVVRCAPMPRLSVDTVRPCL